MGGVRARIVAAGAALICLLTSSGCAGSPDGAGGGRITLKVMIGYIKTQTGSLANRWDVTTVPGGTGDWGGSYLAVPKASGHRREAADLAIWLTSAQQQVAVFEKTGNFPSNRIAAADPAVSRFREPYFGDVADPAPIGRIFGDSAARLPAAVLGARDQVVKDLITKGGITRVEAQGEDPAKSWVKVVRDVTAATG